MKGTPKGVRLHIGLFGRRNVGKSSLLNALTGQETAIVSSTPGTTTDVVTKAMELKPIGPVLLFDTAGLDDTGELGEKRLKKSRKALGRTDIALVITDDGIEFFEEDILNQLKINNTPVILVFNKTDFKKPDRDTLEKACTLADSVVETNAITGDGINELRDAIVKHTPDEILNPEKILKGLVDPGDIIILVVPIDLEAPKGRLILPQVQVLREILDSDARAVITKEHQLPDALTMLNEKPRLVITDSQALLKVVSDVPDEIPVTGFSILYARWKGDVETFVKGTLTIKDLEPGDRVLVTEACTHHPIEGDIGREKIPKWLNSYVGGELEFTHYAGHDFPDDLSTYKIVIMCGSCMINRREVLTRIMKTKNAGVPVANYGLCIAYSLGIFERVLSPFSALVDTL